VLQIVNQEIPHYQIEFLGNVIPKLLIFCTFWDRTNLCADRYTEANLEVNYVEKLFV
jgi:hypothetical protein